jgi:hypothetical protein
MRFDKNFWRSESWRAGARNPLRWFCDAEAAKIVGRVDAVAFVAFVVEGHFV